MSDVIRVIVRSFINGPAAWQLMPMRLRLWLLRAWGIGIGRNCLIYPRFVFASSRLSMGEGCVINWNVTIENGAQVTLGNDVGLGIGMQIHTNTHDVGPTTRRMGRDHSLPVSIGDGCWVGAGVIVLPGVTIGEGCIIAAGAVVTKDCEPNGLYGGVPARRLREVEQGAR